MGRIGAVVLAAGLSQRFGGESKLLADLGGKPLIRHAVEAASAAGLADILVVTGREAEACRAALEGLSVRFVHNAAWKDGMGTSIAVGAAALVPDLDGAFIVPGDMPFLSPDLLRKLISAFDAAGGTAAVYPALADGVQRAPVLWPRHLLPRLAGLSGPEGGKALLREISGSTHAVVVDDGSLLTDVDTADELDAARLHLARLRPASHR